MKRSSILTTETRCIKTYLREFSDEDAREGVFIRFQRGIKGSNDIMEEIDFIELKYGEYGDREFIIYFGVDSSLISRNKKLRDLHILKGILTYAAKVKVNKDSGELYTYCVNLLRKFNFNI